MEVRNEGLERRLVAVMFTDMVGYTALLQADERLARREATSGTGARSSASTRRSAGRSCSGSGTEA